MSKKVRADGPSILRVGFDPERYRALRVAEKEHIRYHLERLLDGEASAVMEWEHFGMKVDVVPWKR